MADQEFLPRPPLALTMGDPAGIGPEICLRALVEPSMLEYCTPVLFCDAGVIHRVSAKRTQTANPTSILNQGSFDQISIQEWNSGVSVSKPLIVDCNALDAGAIKPGEVSAACGRAAYRYIEHAIRAGLSGKVAGVVTAPIHKEALHLSGVAHPGHTEIFTALTGARRSCMMLYSEALTVSMVTTHIGFVDVPKHLSVERVLDVIELTAQTMSRLLGRAARLAICGLNPHAGEHGLFGEKEEERCVVPAVERATALGLNVTGPLPPDAVFTSGQRKNFDAIVTLYHDQGHIPFKMLAFDTGVNVTLGLPIVRTSVDHGTAFDIAWKGIADPSSLYEAIKVAARLAGAVPSTC